MSSRYSWCTRFIPGVIEFVSRMGSAVSKQIGALMLKQLFLLLSSIKVTKNRKIMTAVKACLRLFDETDVTEQSGFGLFSRRVKAACWIFIFSASMRENAESTEWVLM